MSNDSPTELTRTAARVASRRWQKTRRRITLFIPSELCEGVDSEQIRAVAYHAIFKALAGELGRNPEEPPPDAS